MVIDPVTLSAIAGGAGGLGEGIGAALSTPPSYAQSGAESGNLGGFSMPFGDFAVYSTGNLGSGINYSFPASPLATDLNAPVRQSGGPDMELILIVALGGVALWLLTKKK